MTSAASRRFMVVIEDLQWADAATAELLADVATMSRSGRLLCVATTRETATPSPCLSRLDRGGAQRIALSGLQPAALVTMAALAGHDVSGETLHARTGGNPFLARETLRLASVIGADGALSSVPDSVAEVVRQRLAALSPPSLAASQVASVLGRIVAPDVLREVSGTARRRSLGRH